MLKRFFYSIFILLLPILLHAVSVEDNQLYIDVEIVPNTTQIHLTVPGNLTISESGSPFRIDFYQPELFIEIEKPLEVSPYWRVGVERFPTRSEAETFLQNFPECYTEPYTELHYEDGILEVITGYAVFLKERFLTYESAQNICEPDGWVIEEYAFSSASVQVYNAKDGKSYFFSPPFYLTSDQPITVFQVPRTNFWNPKEFVTRSYRGKLKVDLNPAGTLHLISSVELEDYIAGVLPNEIGADAPLEALKAQAIAARSEALYKILHGHHKDDAFDLCASTHCQVFSGISDISEQVNRAVKATAYQVGTYQDEIINAVYSTNCGGHTESSSNVWGGEDVPYLAGIYDGTAQRSVDLTKERNVASWIESSQQVFCNTEEKTGWIKNTYSWQKTISKKAVENYCNSIIDFGRYQGINILSRGVSGRALAIELCGTSGKLVFDGELNIRNTFDNLPSSLFIVEDQGDSLLFKGKGSGHGVGMCQIGALQMAESGYKAEDILRHYYKGIEIIRMAIESR